MSSVPLDTHPRILDAILAHAPYASLLALRSGSTTLRDRVDAALVWHIAVYALDKRVTAVFDDTHRRLPRTRWLDVPALGDAVRVVDICTTPPDEACDRRRGGEVRERTSQFIDQPRRGQRPAESDELPKCRCGEDSNECAFVNRQLAERMRRVRLIRRWGYATCLLGISAPRSVIFSSFRERKNIGALKNPCTAPVHVIHMLYYHHGLPIDIPPTPETTRLVVRITRAVEALADLVRENSAWFTFSAIASLLAEPIRCKLKCTLVGVHNWPISLLLLGDGLRWKLSEWVQLVVFRTGAGEVLAVDDIAKLINVVSDDEYRVSVEEEVYALETYCEPPY